MKYRCIPCDCEFEVKEGAKPRCPRCLKIHDIEPVTQDDGSAAKKSRGRIPAFLAVAVALAAAGYFLFSREEQDGPVSKGPSGLPELLEELGGISISSTLTRK